MRHITKITPLIALGSLVACGRADMPRRYQGISGNHGEASQRTADEILVLLRTLTEQEIRTHATRRPLP